ncbi:hypothetical protein SGQ44_15920 [Flavobacterium sp. Fl-77]|uniref:Uncharacterized protein n=1 Tax=Flavobacterium flavipigmentatum TaxID=2893884 RepID=A0AAJ2SG35_9FLAO|nr:MULTISPECIES: hypothetical protein [unclassified Flavobacterium]MDX6183787.1 hypothetical protein [Flavobacterium sp. Fl-33]MDX6187252.1 hypothetical protein [Flavobacterium sp. Fl-77]UFH38067.1 hypothetical protein LNP22_15165 [Flavobacterium sp. F-70]
MKNKIIIFLLLIFTSVCNAKYSPLLISQLIDNSKIIGIGEIKNVEGKQISVLFSELIKGKLTNLTVKINQFENWTCASRWTNYKRGQKIFFFLTTEKGVYTILGSGNEGELPIQGKKAYYKSPYGGLDKDSTKYLVYGGELFGYTYNLLDVKNGILEYISNKLSFHKIAKQKNIKNVKIENPFLKRLVWELYTEIY